MLAQIPALGEIHQYFPIAARGEDASASMTIGRTPSVNRTTSGRTRQPKGAAVESIDDCLAALSPEKSATLRQVREAVRTVASESPMQSSGRRWSSGSATCCSTTWLGRCGAFLSSSSTGTAIIRSNPSTSKTLRSRRWRLALRAGTPSPTDGRTPSPSRLCCVCWPPQWA